MPREVDVIVVGAGPAGCAAAYDLAKSGVEALILEKRNFPRTKPCGGALTTKAVKALRFSIAPVIRVVVTDFVAAREFTKSKRLRSRYPVGAMTVREELDDFVLHQTIAAGATMQKIDRLLEITSDDESVTVKLESGSIRAKFLIGADGANSSVRHLIDANEQVQFGFAIEAQVKGHAVDPAMIFDFGMVPRGYGWIFPKGDHYNVGLYTYDARFGIMPGQLRAYVKQKALAADCEHVVGHPLGLGGWRHAPDRKRIFLVGDAAGLCEPLLGEGIYYAISSGQMAAAAVTAELKEGKSACQSFRRSLDSLRADLRFSSALAMRFYRDLGLGCLGLTATPLHYVLMKAYSLGIPLGEIPRNLPLLPFRRVTPPPDLCQRSSLPAAGSGR
ncbi:MAG TPA: geranylgeranyl reductase family protein [Thermoanaerobaculia bacterium]|jgi:geranylgeranyl reductase family protein|nr:geranylgeranyl reductase family protein [Thermoanaerobaculia bacterium]